MAKNGPKKTYDVKQLQKRYMVSGSLCPLISFLDVSYWYHQLERPQTQLDSALSWPGAGWEGP